jgi:PKD repeat protein
MQNVIRYFFKYEDSMINPNRKAGDIILIILFALIFMPPLAQSETASPSDMTQVCQNWLTEIVYTKGNWAGSNNPQISGTFDIARDGVVLGRYFEISPSGFVVVPVLKEMLPIKAYSEDSRLDFSSPEGVGALITDVLSSYIADFTSLYGSISVPQSAQTSPLFAPEQKEVWNTYLQSNKSFLSGLSSKAKAEVITYGPLLTTTWHQNAPYNNSCPSGDGGRTVVGCVATAASQIMAYHRWPLIGKGTKTYYWGGDTSCDGSTPGKTLKADFNDPYDWDNIPNYCSSSGPLAQRLALAELCYEVGVAFEMDYGYCGSGAYTADALTVFPQYFRYRNTTIRSNRASLSLREWSAIIRDEMAAGRPAQYRIMSHSIVCDGWQDTETEIFYHMNYGWGGNQNAWFAFDDLYCNWTGCSTSEEFIITGIAPDRRAYFTADTTYGYLPFAVNFTGNSSFSTVDSWKWYFGDGDSSETQSPAHTYNTAGYYTVTLKTVSGTDTGTYIAENFIAALNDSLIGPDIQAFRGSQIEVIISGHNIVPVKRIVIPVTYAGSLNLEYVDHSVSGCRIEYFDYQAQPGFDGDNKRMSFIFENTNANEQDLAPGSGPLLKLYFTIPAGATLSQTASITFDPWSSYSPTFANSNFSYSPTLVAGDISIPFICGDPDRNGTVNLLDVNNIIKYLYWSGPAPNPLQAADVDSNNKINLLDVNCIIKFLYYKGPAPHCQME